MLYTYRVAVHVGKGVFFLGYTQERLMTVFCNIHHYCLLPAEQEVAEAGARRHCDAQVPVVRHEHQHEEVTDHHLDDVKKRLEEVCETQHLLAGGENRSRSLAYYRIINVGSSV